MFKKKYLRMQYITETQKWYDDTHENIQHIENHLKGLKESFKFMDDHESSKIPHNYDLFMAHCKKFDKHMYAIKAHFDDIDKG